MAYVALYRKFRPPTFEDVKGQDHIVTTLKNQIKADRVGHAYLFCGTRGTGKTSVAKILSRAVNCEHPVDGNPCGECETCKAIQEGRCVDVVEIDAASNNGVDNIRTIIDEVSYSPTTARKKVYIIDEVHMLSTGAFNALLKTLEEPPEYVIFILATTEVQKIPITILSRCQRYDFHRITIDTIEDRLKEVTKAESISVEERALRYIARAADGSMRDSLSLLDQCIAFNYGEELTYDRVLNVLGAVDTTVFGNLFSALYHSDAEEALRILAEVVIQGREMTQFVNDFVWYLRNLMLVNTAEDMEDVVDISSDNLKTLKDQAGEADMDTIMRYISVFSELSSNLRFAAQKRILIEMALIRICRPQMDDASGEALKDRVRIMEEHDRTSSKLMKQIQNGQIAVTAAPAAGALNEAAPLPAKKLDRAVPEDIQKVVDGFQGFLNRMTDNAIKNMMTSDRPGLSLGADNTLQMVFSKAVSGSFMEMQKERLEQEIADVFGKKVPVEIRTLAKGERFASSYVDLEASLGAINFDVVTEEEELPPGMEKTAQQRTTAYRKETEASGDNGVTEDASIETEAGEMPPAGNEAGEKPPAGNESEEMPPTGNESEEMLSALEGTADDSGRTFFEEDSSEMISDTPEESYSPSDDGNSFEENDGPEDDYPDSDAEELAAQMMMDARD